MILKIFQMGITFIAIMSFCFTILLDLIKSPFSFTFSLEQDLAAKDLVLKSLTAHIYLSILIKSTKLIFLGLIFIQSKGK
jgi:hypothetical protein